MAKSLKISKEVIRSSKQRDTRYNGQKFEEQANNALTESVEIYLHFNIFVVFIMSLSLDDGGIRFYRPFVKKRFLCNNLKTPQHNHIKIICLKMLLRTSDTDKGRISICGVFCIFRFLSSMMPDICVMPLLLVCRAFVSWLFFFI